MPPPTVSKYVTRVLLAFALLLLLPFRAGATDLNMDIRPSLLLAQGWDSNVFNRSTDEVSDFFFRASPGLGFLFRTSDNAVINLSGHIEKTWYFNHPEAELHRLTYIVRLTANGETRITRKLFVTPSGYHFDTVNSTRRTELQPSADPVVPPGTIHSYANVRTEEFGGGLVFRYVFTPNLFLRVRGNYGEIRFHGDNVAAAELSDSKAASWQAELSGMVTAKASLGVYVSGEHQRFEDAPNAATLTGGGSFGYQITPGLHFNARLGATSVRRDAAPGTPADKQTGPSGGLFATYMSGTTIVTAFGTVNYVGATGFSGSTRQKAVGISLSDQFTPRWSGRLGGSYQVSRSVFESNALDLATTYETALVRYQPREWFWLDLTGTYLQQWSDGEIGSPLERYTVLLGANFALTYPIF
jgi:hypothetical protein